MADDRRDAGHETRDEEPRGVSRRDLLEAAARLGGGGALFGALASLGLARIATAQAPVPPVGALGAGRRVAILGGGVGGLAAAYELLQRDFQVRVLEANSRTGGRSLTLRPGDRLKEDGWPEQGCTFQTRGTPPYPPYLNAGPGRLPSAHTHILDYCKKLDVALEVYVMESRSSFVYGSSPALVNRHAGNDARGHIASLLYGMVDSIRDLDATQRGQLKELLRVFGALGDDGAFLAGGPSDRRYAKSTRSGYRELPGVDDGEPVVPYELPQLLATSFWKTQFYQPEDFLWQPTLFQPVGGMDFIEGAFRAAIEARDRSAIEVNAEVKRILRDGSGKWQIRYGDGKTYTADVVISNIPMPLLGPRLDLAGLREPFRTALRTVIDTTDFLAPTCKVGWQAPRALWQSPDPPRRVVPIYGGISWTTHPITQLWYPSDRIHDELGVLTGAYNYRDNAIAWGKLSPAERLQRAREGARQVGGDAFADGLANGITIAWQNMPFQRGGWAQWEKVTPGDTARSMSTYNTILEGDRDFFVVGDQASKLPGWKEGAVASALHIVQQLTDPTYEVPEAESVPNSQALAEGLYPMEM